MIITTLAILFTVSEMCPASFMPEDYKAQCEAYWFTCMVEQGYDEEWCWENMDEDVSRIYDSFLSNDTLGKEEFFR